MGGYVKPKMPVYRLNPAVVHPKVGSAVCSNFMLVVLNTYPGGGVGRVLV
jgi:hypothetical protein